MILEIKTRNLVLAIKGFGWFTLFLVLGIAFFGFERNNFYQSFSILIVGVCIQLVPVIWLHLEYYLRNRGETFEVKYKELTLIKNGEKRSYFASEIKSITAYMMPSRHVRSGIRYFVFEEYHYAKITLKNGKHLIITSLLIANVEDALKHLGLPYKREKAFPTLFWE